MKKLYYLILFNACFFSSVITLDASVEDYNVLNLKVGACERDIKKAYFQASLQWHPDRHVNASNADRLIATEKFQKLNAAYGAICNKDKKVVLKENELFVGLAKGIDEKLDLYKDQLPEYLFYIIADPLESIFHAQRRLDIINRHLAQLHIIKYDPKDAVYYNDNDEESIFRKDLLQHFSKIKHNPSVIFGVMNAKGSSYASLPWNENYLALENGSSSEQQKVPMFDNYRLDDVQPATYNSVNHAIDSLTPQTATSVYIDENIYTASHASKAQRTVLGKGLDGLRGLFAIGVDNSKK